jgi:fimbrial isopeptide formation D2 family protein/uncharacterized repeat protein (TIGR01451 family)
MTKLSSPRSSGFVRGALSVAIACGAVLAGVADAAAAPTPQCSATSPGPVLVGDLFTSTFTYSNTGDAPGFLPAIDLRLPPGITIVTAMVSDQAASVTPPVPFISGTALHPITTLSVSGTSGWSLSSVVLPFSSQAPGFDDVDVTITFMTDNAAVVGTPLVPTGACTYLFGTDALNNAATDAPIAAAPTSVPVTPSVVTVTKRASAGAACQGPSFPFDWIFEIDVATGWTLNASRLTDNLNDDFQTLAVTAAGAASTFTPAGPGGVAQVNYGAIVGVAGVDRQISISGHALTGTVNPAAPSPVSFTNVGTLAASGGGGMGFSGPGGSGTQAPVGVAPAATIEINGVLIQETLTPNPGSPGDTVRVSLDICVSDDFGLTSATTVTSLLPDGMTYAGDPTPSSPTVTGSDPTTVEFALGALAGGTSLEVAYDATIDQTYASSDPIYGGDILPTVHTLAGTVAATGAAVSATDATSGTDDSQRITVATLSKTLVAVNGGAPGAFLSPGDVATYEVTAVVPSGDQAELALTDFLPPPMLSALEHGASGTVGVAGPVRFGPAHFDTTQVVPWSASALDNSLEFIVPAFSRPAGPITVQFRFDFTVSAEPAEDGVALTNVATMVAEASGGTQSARATAAVPSLLGEPKLVITKGAIAVTGAPGAVLSPALSSSCALPLSSPIDGKCVSDVTGVDAGDSVTFRILVANTGRAAAHRATIQDVLPAGLTVLGSPTVRNGNGVSLAHSGTLATGLELTAPLPGKLAAAGTNVAVIDVVAIVGSIAATQTLTNQAEITSYRGTATGPNFVTGNRPKDSATVTTRNFRILKTRQSVAGQVTIGSLIDYRIVVTVPEGTQGTVTIADVLDAELITVADPVVVMSGGLTAVQSLVRTAGGFTLTLTGLDNANRLDASAEIVTLTYQARVNNIAASQETDDVVDNRGTVSWPTGNSTSSTASSVDIEEPSLTVGTVVTPTTADSLDTVSWTVTLAHGPDSFAAHDVHYALGPLPATLQNLTFVSSGGTAAAPSIVATASGITADWTTIALGQTATLTFTAQVAAGAAIGSSLSIPAVTTWTSLAGVDANERTGAGGVNDYSVSSAATITVASATLTHTRTSGATATIGETVDYTIAVTVPEGTKTNFVITDTLPAGMAFVASDTFVNLDGFECDRGAGFVPCTLPTPSVAGQVVSWDFGTIRNAQDDADTESLSFHAQLVVADNAAANRGDSKAPVAAAGAATATAAAITVLEPTLTATLALAPAAPDGGDVVTLTTTVQNPAVASGAAGHDAVLTYDLASAQLSGNAASFSAGTCVGATATITGSSATVTVPSLALAASCQFSFTSTVASAVAANSTLTVDAAITWTSLAGVVAGERTGAGGVDDYRATFARSLGTAGGAVVKTLASSSLADTTAPDLWIGETVTYHLDVTVPDGVSNPVIVTDSPPPGLAITGVSVDTSNFDGTIATPPTAASGASGEAIAFDLGSVTATAGAGQTDNVIRLVVTAKAVFDSENRTTPTGVNRAALTIAGAAQGPASTVPVNIALPAPVIGIAASDLTPTENQVITITASVDNSAGTGPVCDTDVTITVPAGFTVTPPGTDGLDNDDDGDTDDAEEAAIATAPIVVTVVGCIDPGDGRTLPFELTAPPAIPPTPFDVSASLGEYQTLAAGEGELLAPASDNFDTNGVAGTDESGDQTATLIVSPDAPALTLTKAAADLNGGALSPGDTLRYTITLANTGTGSATGIVIADDLPVGPGQYVVDSATTSLGTVDVSAGVLTATIGTVAAATTVTIRFDYALRAPLADGTSVSNQAALTASDGYGDLVSDDPSTPAANDPTVRTVASPSDLDGDGVVNASDSDPNDPTVCSDLDGDSCEDCSVASLQQPGNDGADADGDGVCDAGELSGGTDPDDADSDDDGVLDVNEPDRFGDADGDGLINALDPDSDNDGLLDGTELGVTAADLGPDTDLGAGNFVPDGDGGATTTDPLNRDTDGGGASDGAEDTDKDGVIDGGERNPTAGNGADDGAGGDDADGDGLTDAEEAFLGTDPNDADSDDDGLVDGDEPNFANDTDGDGLINALDADSDNDGLFDGTERATARRPRPRHRRWRRLLRAGRGRRHTTTNPLGRHRRRRRGRRRRGCQQERPPSTRRARSKRPRRTTSAPSDSDGDGLTDAEELAASAPTRTTPTPTTTA